MPIDRNSAQYITGAIYKPTQTSAPGVWDLDDQANNIAKNLWPLPPQAVQRSLRFNRADSTVLTRTPTVAGNRRTWTWSGWFKTSGLLNANYHLFDTQPSATYTGAYITSTGALEFRDYQTGFIWVLTTSTLYRDPSAWYHVVFVHDTTQATASDRIKIYVNGTQVTQFSTATYPSLNYQSNYNNTVIQYLGGFDGTTNGGFTGFIAEVNSIDGQALTPASFAETDPQTGVWIPKRYTGTYGTNGFRLSFANNSSITALGYDSSGQGNNWTPNNFSVTPGVGNDVFVDVPSLYGTDTGLGGEVLGNYATLNPLQTNSNGQTLSDGNLQVTMAAATDQWRTNKSGTVLPRGKWYFEATLLTMPAGSNAAIGIGYINVNQSGDTYIGKYANQGGSGIEFGAQGNTIGAAIDLETGRADYYKNGILTASFTGLDLTQTYEVLYAVAQPPNKVIAFNFGQRPFTYAAPSGYKALCTTNLPAPAIGQTSSNRAGNYFNVVTYTGDGAASKSITGVGFQPDLVWIKSRTNASGYHILVDSVRGAGLWMATNATAGDSTAGQLVSSLDANGFSLNLSPNNTVNELNANYVAWCWKKSRAAGFDVVTSTANASAVVTYNHSLGVAPAFVISKSRSATVPWLVYHKSLGANQYLLLNTSDAVTTLNGVYSSSLSQFSITSQTANASYVAYIFAEVPGFSTFGSYTGNASTDGAFVYTGFRPAFILIKDVNNANSWILMDNKRTGAYNPQDGWLVAQATDAEYNVSTSDSRIDFLSNGFKLRNSNAGNNASRTYIYAAFAETPARLSTAR